MDKAGKKLLFKISIRRLLEEITKMLRFIVGHAEGNQLAERFVEIKGDSAEDFQGQ